MYSTNKPHVPHEMHGYDGSCGDDTCKAVNEAGQIGGMLTYLAGTAAQRFSPNGGVQNMALALAAWNLISSAVGSSSPEVGDTANAETIATVFTLGITLPCYGATSTANGVPLDQKVARERVLTIGRALRTAIDKALTEVAALDRDRAAQQN